MRPKTRKGVTIIELIMAIVIVGVLTGASSMYIKEIVDLWNFLSFRNEAVSQARTALIRMEKEIRQIKDDSSVYAATGSRLRFNDVNSLSIDYQLSGTNLFRNADILAVGVNSLVFTYYDKNNSPIASPLVNPDRTDIYRISLGLTVRSGTQSKVLKTLIFPRNL